MTNEEHVYEENYYDIQNKVIKVDKDVCNVIQVVFIMEVHHELKVKEVQKKKVPTLMLVFNHNKEIKEEGNEVYY